MSNFLVLTEILSAIFAAIFYFKYKNTSAKLLLVILWSVSITECFGWIMAEKRIFLYKDTYSYWLFNIMFPIWKILYLFVFYKILENKIFKLWTKRFVIVYFLAVVINWIFLQNFLTELESYSRILGAIFLVLAAIFYLIELLRSDKIIIFHKKLLFWISIGILIFYGGTIPFVIVQNFYSHLDYVHSIYLIIYLLGSLMYLLFTFGFIWSKKE